MEVQEVVSEELQLRRLRNLSMREKSKREKEKGKESPEKSMVQSRSSTISSKRTKDYNIENPKTAFDLLTQIGKTERSLTRSTSLDNPRMSLRRLKKRGERKSVSQNTSLDELPEIEICLVDLPELPDKIWKKIFSFLSVKDLTSGVGRTSKEMRSLAYSPELWKKIDFSLMKGSSEVNHGDVAIINLLFRIGTGGSILTNEHELSRTHPNDEILHCYLPVPPKTPYKSVGTVTNRTLRNYKNESYVDEIETAIIKNDSRWFNTMEFPKYLEPERFGMCSSVRSIKFSYSWPVSSVGIYAIGHLCGGLTTLDLGPFYNHVGPKSLIYLFKNCRKIKNLVMKSNQSTIPESVMTAMAENLGESLKRLEISRFQGHKCLSFFRSLTYLDLEGAFDFDDNSIHHIKKARGLETLILNSTGVTSLAIELIKNWFPLLRRLEMKNVELDDTSVESLSNGSLYMLQSLAIEGKEVSDTSAFHIASGTFSKSIKRLAIMKAQLTEKGKSKLDHSCENLKKLLI